MSPIGDLTQEEKAMVIGGFVAVGTILAGGISFIEFALNRSQIDRLWASGLSFFGVAKTVLPTFYLFLFLPPAISVSVTLACIRRRFSDLAVGAFLLAITSAAFLLVYLFLSLFDVLFAGLPVAMQAPFVLIALFVPAILLTLLIKTKKVNGYIKKSFG